MKDSEKNGKTNAKGMEESEGKKKRKMFWRVQRECWRRMVTPFLMYLFMSLLALACSAFTQKYFVLEVILEALCIVIGALFNGHLCYHYGKIHYDAYLTGCLHRKNALFGIVSGGDHRAEREYSPWKGFYIGFLIGIPTILFGGIGHVSNWARLILLMFIGWSYLPVYWVQEYRKLYLGYEEGYLLSSCWSILMILLPIIVSGVMYMVGAYVNRRKKEKQV